MSKNSNLLNNVIFHITERENFVLPFFRLSTVDTTVSS